MCYHYDSRGWYYNDAGDDVDVSAADIDNDAGDDHHYNVPDHDYYHDHHGPADDYVDDTAADYDHYNGPADDDYDDCRCTDLRHGQSMSVDQ